MAKILKVLSFLTTLIRHTYWMLNVYHTRSHTLIRILSWIFQPDTGKWKTPANEFRNAKKLYAHEIIADMHNTHLIWSRLSYQSTLHCMEMSAVELRCLCFIHMEMGTISLWHGMAVPHLFLEQSRFTKYTHSAHRHTLQSGKITLMLIQRRIWCHPMWLSPQSSTIPITLFFTRWHYFVVVVAGIRVQDCTHDILFWLF